MKQALKKLWKAVARMFAQPVTMANEGGASTANPGAGSGAGEKGFDFKKMVYALLGCSDDASPEMVNERYEAAMKHNPDEDDAAAANESQELKTKLEGEAAKRKDLEKKVTDATNRVTELETQMANEVNAKAELQKQLDEANDKATKNAELFANERKARSKELLDAGITAGIITAAERKDLEVEMANEGTFDAAVSKLAAKGKALPSSNVTKNLGERRRQHGEGGEQSTRIAKVQEEVQVIMANEKCTYDVAFAKVQEKRPDLFKAMKKPGDDE